MLIAFLQNAILYIDFLYLIEIEISRRADDTVYKIFQDPTARHCIICLKSFESLLSRNSKKPKPIPKLKVSMIWILKYGTVPISIYCILNVTVIK